MDMNDHLEIMLNGTKQSIQSDGMLLNHLKEKGTEPPHLCYHESLGALETCDACIVKVNGEYVRSCSTTINEGDVVETVGDDIHEAQLIAMDRILCNHELYCTVCDFNNGNCEIHNTVKEMRSSHKNTAHTSKDQEVQRNAFYRYDPDKCILCGRCVEACRYSQ